MENTLRKRTILFLILFVLSSQVLADPWADEVIEVEYGFGAGYGQDYFPNNILGPPDTAATELFPSANPEELLTLGSGGSIILVFNDGGITDGEGPDFTVFENVFLHLGEFPFQETAFVEVSEDGESWFRFSHDDETLIGLAGVTPTIGSADPTNPSISGGDSFDLADLGLERVYYVKLIDTEGFVNDSGPSFDLDAVVAINGENGNSVDHEKSLPLSHLLLTTWPNPFNSTLSVQLENWNSGNVALSIYDITGRLILTSGITGNKWFWKPENLRSGLYVIRAVDELGNSATQKVYYLK